MPHEDLTALVRDAHTRNTANQISGVLLHQDGHFVQILEGPKNRVRRLMDKIQQDPRHSDTRVFFESFAARRNFPGWGMGYLSSESEAQLADRIFRLLNEQHTVDPIAYDHDIAPLLRAKYRRFVQENPNANHGPLPLLLPHSLNELKEQFRICMGAHSHIFDMLHNTHNDGVWVVHSARPEIAWCNKNLRHYVGYDSSDFDGNGTWWTHIFGAEDKAKLMREVEHLAGTEGNSTDLLLQASHRDGHRLWHRMHLISLKIPDGLEQGATLVIGVVSDMGGQAEQRPQIRRARS